jgi:thioredoxin reductase (NADPH)
MTQDVRDVTIIGGGPAGLYAAFYAGMRQRSVRVIDSLPELGGQLMALYPEKEIYDVGGFPRIRARALGEALIEQALQFDPDVVLNEEVLTLEHEEDLIVLEGRSGEFATRSLILAGGRGAFEPRTLECPGYDEFLGRGIHHAVKDPEEFRGRRLLLVGGGDSALDWTLALRDVASRLTLVHRRDRFRAHERTAALLHEAVEGGEVVFHPHHEVKEVRGVDRLEGALLFDNRSGKETEVEADAILSFLGFRPDLGPIKSWGLERKGNRVVVNRLMETNLPGVYGAGDLVTYEGKLDLIATGFAEAAIAVNNAVHRVDPNARVNPGHSTNMKIFK